MLIVFVLNIRLNIRFFTTIFALVVFLLLISISFNDFMLYFDELVVNRLKGYYDTGLDNSAFLRGVVPLHLLMDIFNNADLFLFGAGIGGIDNLFLLNNDQFWYMYNWKGDSVSVVNNGYINIILLIGFPLSFLFFLLLFLKLYKSKISFSLKLFVLIYPFFSGFVIHPLFWLFLILVCRRCQLPRNKVVRIPVGSTCIDIS